MTQRPGRQRAWTEQRATDNMPTPSECMSEHPLPSSPQPDLALYRLPGLPLIQPGDRLAPLIVAAVERAGLEIRQGDVLAVAQKIVSRAEGCFVDLADIEPSAEAQRLATITGKDARAVELVLRESRNVIRAAPGVLIVEHRLGIVLANAGIDRSNVAGREDLVLLLPEDPDRSARQLRDELTQRVQRRLGVIITDSVGRPWRLGTTGLAIGCAGVPAVQDLRGRPDLYGRPMQVAEIAPADSLATAAALLSGEGEEGTPVVLIRGYPGIDSEQSAQAVLRPAAEDLFR